MEEEKINLLNINDDQEVRYNNNSMEPCWGSFLNLLGKFFGCCCLFTSCGCCCNPYKTVNSGTKGVITRFGSVKNVVDTGLHYVNPITEQMTTVDMMTHARKLSNQSVLTNDNLPLTIDGVVFYRVNNTKKDIIRSKFGVYNVSNAVDELAHGALRFVFGQYTLQDCLEKRKEIAHKMQQTVEEQANGWGITIQDIQIIDITIPKHIQDMLASKAVAQRDAEAQLIMAQSKVKSAHMIKEAADQLNSPAALQMGLLETYKHLAESENAKIIFLPMDYRNLDNLTANIVGNEMDKKK